MLYVLQEFGDGIMSAIDMFATVDDVVGSAGEKRMVITLNGKVMTALSVYLLGAVARLFCNPGDLYFCEMFAGCSIVRCFPLDGLFMYRTERLACVVCSSCPTSSRRPRTSQHAPPSLNRLPSHSGDHVISCQLWWRV